MKLAREPVAVTNAILGILQALLAVLVAFGVLQFSPEQTAAVMGLAAAVFVLVNILIVRPQVTPLIDPRDDEGQSLQAVRQH